MCQDNLQTPEHLALASSLSCASTVSRIDESLLILSQKRRTVEEKIIFRYFHRLAAAYAGILNFLHTSALHEESLDSELVHLLNRLQIVSANVCECVDELLKILKYDFNYLEQYFEYDYSARLLANEQLPAELEEIRMKLSLLSSGREISGQ